MNDTLKNWLLYGALALLPVVWLWPAAFAGNTFVPFDPARFPPVSMTLSADELAAVHEGANLDVTEVWPWFLPETELVAERTGPWQISTWNPHARSGAPIQEHGLDALLYPPQRAALFVDEPRDLLVWQCWLSLALAGVFLAGLLREVKLPHMAAFFGAASFELSTTLAVNSFFWMRLAALIWLPAILWALMRLSHGKRYRAGPLIATAVAVAMPWLAGFPPYAVAGLFVAGLLAAMLVLERFARDGIYAGRALALRFAVAVFLGLLLAAPQLLPSFWLFTFESARSANPGIEVLHATRFDTYGLLGYLMPDAFGHPIDGRQVPYAQTPLPYLWMDRYGGDGRLAPSNYNYTEYSVFFGTLGVLLAGYGAVRGRQHRRWWLLLVLGALFGLALFLPVVRWLFYLPFFKSVFAMRWLAVATPLLCWLAAIGYDRLALVERRSVVRLALVAFGLAVLAFWLPGLPAAWHADDPNWLAQSIADRYGIPVEGAAGHLLAGSQGADWFAIALARFATAGTTAGWWLLLAGGLLLGYALVRSDRQREWLRLLLPLAAIVQLGLQGGALVPGQRLAHDTETAVHAFLRERADADTAEGGGGFMIARGSPVATLPIQLPPGQLMHRGIRDLQFYSHGDKRWIEALRQALGLPATKSGKSYFDLTLTPEQLAHPLFDLFGVRYVLATVAMPGLGDPVGPEFVGARGGRFLVYERTSALPRAFTVGEVIDCGSDDAVLERMVSGSTDWPRQALVAAAPASSATTTDPAGDRIVRFVTDDPTTIELEIEAGGDRWLVLTDTWFPGWSVTVDGAAAAIERCNHCQRLVRLPASACRVRFDYTTNLLTPALLLHIAALLVLVVIFVRSRRSRAPSNGDETSA